MDSRPRGNDTRRGTADSRQRASPKNARPVKIILPARSPSLIKQEGLDTNFNYSICSVAHFRLKIQRGWG